MKTVEVLFQNPYEQIKSTIDALHGIKTDDELYKLMEKVTDAAGDALVAEKDSLKSIQYIAILKIYFEIMRTCKSRDATIIAFSIAEILEFAEKTSRVLAKKLLEKSMSQ